MARVVCIAIEGIGNARRSFQRSAQRRRRDGCAASARPAQAIKVSFCVALISSGDNGLKMLAAWKKLNDHNRELTVADFGSTDLDRKR